jgi:plasmid maintenance system antidote protein VapI
VLCKWEKFEALRAILQIPAATDRTPPGSAQLWLNLQNDFDVEVARRELGRTLDRIVTVNRPKAA